MSEQPALHYPEMIEVHEWMQTNPLPLLQLPQALQEVEAADWEPFQILGGFTLQHNLAVNRQQVPAVIIVFRSRKTKRVPKVDLPGSKPAEAPKNALKFPVN